MCNRLRKFWFFETVPKNVTFSRISLTAKFSNFLSTIKTMFKYPGVNLSDISTEHNWIIFKKSYRWASQLFQISGNRRRVFWKKWHFSKSIFSCFYQRICFLLAYRRSNRFTLRTRRGNKAIFGQTKSGKSWCFRIGNLSGVLL